MSPCQYSHLPSVTDPSPIIHSLIDPSLIIPSLIDPSLVSPGIKTILSLFQSHRRQSHYPCLIIPSLIDRSLITPGIKTISQWSSDTDTSLIFPVAKTPVSSSSVSSTVVSSLQVSKQYSHCSSFTDASLTDPSPNIHSLIDSNLIAPNTKNNTLSFPVSLISLIMSL